MTEQAEQASRVSMHFVKQVISRLTSTKHGKRLNFVPRSACSKLRGSGMSHDDGMEDANRPWNARERELVKNMESNLEQSVKIRTSKMEESWMSINRAWKTA